MTNKVVTQIAQRVCRDAVGDDVVIGPVSSMPDDDNRYFFFFLTYDTGADKPCSIPLAALRSAEASHHKFRRSLVTALAKSPRLVVHDVTGSGDVTEDEVDFYILLHRLWPALEAECHALPTDPH